MKHRRNRTDANTRWLISNAQRLQHAQLQSDDEEDKRRHTKTLSMLWWAVAELRELETCPRLRRGAA